MNDGAEFFFSLGAIVGFLIAVALTHIGESSCQKTYDVADCKIVYLPVDFNEESWTLDGDR